MIDHGYQEVALSRIVLPGDFTAYVKAHAQEVDDLAGARKALLLAHAPTVEKKTMGLVAGRRRIAGLLNDGVKRTWVHLVDGTPADLRRLTASENLHRGHRDDLAALQAAYVDAIEADLTEEAAELTDASPRKPGRPKTPKGEARDRAARDLGTTPEALRKAEARAVAKSSASGQPTSGSSSFSSENPMAEGEEGAGASPGKQPAPEAPIRMLGLTARARWLDDVRDTIATLHVLDGGLRKLQGDAGRLPNRAQAQAVKQRLHDEAERIRAALPEVACAYCRDPDGSAGRAKACSACGGLGYLTREQAQRIPPELQLPGAAPVVRQAPCGWCGGAKCGQGCRYDSKGTVAAVASPKPLTAEQAFGRRRPALKIEVNGREMSPRELTVEREDSEEGAPL